MLLDKDPDLVLGRHYEGRKFADLRQRLLLVEEQGIVLPMRCDRAGGSGVWSATGAFLGTLYPSVAM
jgi:hypothetical protein